MNGSQIRCFDFWLFFQIYPRIKDLYEDVGKFSALFVQNYDGAESKIESLRQEYLTDEEFEYDLAKNLKVLEEMGV